MPKKENLEAKVEELRKTIHELEEALNSATWERDCYKRWLTSAFGFDQIKRVRGSLVFEVDWLNFEVSIDREKPNVMSIDLDKLSPLESLVLKTMPIGQLEDLAKGFELQVVGKGLDRVIIATTFKGSKIKSFVSALRDMLKETVEDFVKDMTEEKIKAWIVAKRLRTDDTDAD